MKAKPRCNVVKFPDRRRQADIDYERVSRMVKEVAASWNDPAFRRQRVAASVAHYLPVPQPKAENRLSRFVGTVEQEQAVLDQLKDLLVTLKRRAAGRANA